MNRIGNRVIKFDDKISVNVAANLLTVKGPKGSLQRQFTDLIDINVKDNEITTSTKSSTRHAKAMLGTTNSHIFNMITGVTQGFKKQLIIVGVGYRAAVKNDTITLSLGYSHPVILKIPQGVNVSVTRNTIIIVEGIDKEKVGHFAEYIRSHRKPEPYLGKGIKYDGEHIIRKVGKTINK